MDRLTKINAWKKLQAYAKTNMNQNSETQNYILASNNIKLDFSGQHLNSEVINLLFELAEECNVQEQINAMFSGKRINSTENRSVLHIAFRAPEQASILVDGNNVIPEVVRVRNQMKEIATKMRAKQWLGYSGKPITDIVNIGIGGSMLGPFFCLKALSDLVTKELGFHFISDIDPNAFLRATEALNPETTLFIISSKSFTTPETLAHFQKALSWINQEQDFNQHFIAITAHTDRAQEFGLKNILPIWDWVGGRYSFCSAINLISCIAIGFQHFSEILKGAYEMDEHFCKSPYAKNIPVLMALLGIWNIDFLNINNLLILLYTQDLEYFVPYLQQLDMESNGKSVNKEGLVVDYATGPIIWGGLGNHAQHSYYQLLCQGTQKIAADFINVHTFDGSVINNMCYAHREILSNGGNHCEDPYGYIKGEMPVNIISLFDSSPRTLGSLIALYEHKVFVQGVIWNINSFDQPGVESSKEIVRQNKWIN